ncbi:hypothetical protein FD755_025535 [Muntiacus reevesi]|uniref:USP domain-containing protein n=1 Tax=Muntiacus reevesi TaxID=9886 RepID=A0A5N3ULT3_MUNRE|nr:hypothetical protein FD755_025535 [Muntiacus reevesi]
MERLVGLVCRDPVAASTHGGDACPSPFNVLPGGQGFRPSTAGADALRGPSVPEGPPPAVGRPQRGDLAPGSAGLAPGHQVTLSWRDRGGLGLGSLQCLSHTPPLASWVVSEQQATLCPACASCTLCAVRAHVTQALLHRGEVIQPCNDLLAGFHRHQQEVAHEFLMFTLNAMQQGCLSASQPSGHPSEDTSLIRQIFGRTWRSQIQCPHCLGVSDTFDPYLDISLDITEAQSVEQALRELVKPEKLDAENAYDCGACLRKVPATKRLTLHSTSQVLVLVLKRFTQCLDLQPYTSERKAGPLGFMLYAVLVHSGWSCERGHYFSYLRRATATARAGGGAAAPLTADPTHPGETDPAGPGELVGDASGRAPGLQVSPGDTEVEAISLEQWRRLQEHNRPKPAFGVRKIQSAMPAGAVVIHQSKHRGGRDGKLPGQEHDGLDGPSTDSPSPGPTSVGNGPCASRRARATKRKNKKPRPSLGCGGR